MAENDQTTRAALLRLLEAQREEKRRVDQLCLRGKQCPIQRPMRDAWRGKL